MGDLLQLAAARERRAGPRHDKTKDDVAAHFKVTIRTVTRWMSRGLPFDQPYEHGAVRFSIPECESWCRRHRRKR